jgi:hypothetical protein
VASGFQWTGASLQPSGSLQTARWAAGLKDWSSRNAVGLRARDGTEVFWAFPSALQRLKAGMRYDARNYDVGESICYAPPGSVKIIIEYYAAVDYQLRAVR